MERGIINRNKNAFSFFSKLQSVLTIHARLVSSKGWHYSFPIDAVEFQWGKNVFIILTLNIREYEALGVYDDKGEDEHKEANRWWRKKTENAVMSWSELTFYPNGKDILDFTKLANQTKYNSTVCQALVIIDYMYTTRPKVLQCQAPLSSRL